MRIFSKDPENEQNHNIERDLILKKSYNVFFLCVMNNSSMQKLIVPAKKMKFFLKRCKFTIFYILLVLSVNMLHAVPGPSFISIGRSQGKAIGVEEAYTSVEILSFLFRDQALLPFFNIKADYFDGGGGGVANVGGGIRFAPKTSNMIYGLNAYYDYRESHGSSFSMLGVGLELLGERFGFRVNGYGPIGRNKALISTCIFDNYIGDYIMIKKKYLTNCGGGDFSFDILLKNEPGGIFRIGLGAYYFNRSDRGSKIFGPEYRVTVDITRYWRLGVLGTYDRVFGNKLQAQIMLTLPLGDRREEEEGVFQRIQRKDLMILQDNCCWITNF